MLIQHALRVGFLSKQVAMQLGLDENRLFLAGILHDVGKICLDQNILNKPGKLTDLEFHHIQKHVEYGVEILKPYISEDILSIISQHHENQNGTGYPKGIKCGAMDSKVLRACDVFDALTSDRSYRKGYDTSKALNIMLEEKENFDKEIIEVIANIKRQGVKQIV